MREERILLIWFVTRNDGGIFQVESLDGKEGCTTGEQRANGRWDRYSERYQMLSGTPECEVKERDVEVYSDRSSRRVGLGEDMINAARFGC